MSGTGLGPMTRAGLPLGHLVTSAPCWARRPCQTSRSLPGSSGKMPMPKTCQSRGEDLDSSSLASAFPGPWVLAGKMARMGLVRKPFGWELQPTRDWLAVLCVHGCLMWGTRIHLKTCLPVIHREQTIPTLPTTPRMPCYQGGRCAL